MSVLLARRGAQTRLLHVVVERGMSHLHARTRDGDVTGALYLGNDGGQGLDALVTAHARRLLDEGWSLTAGPDAAPSLHALLHSHAGTGLTEQMCRVRDLAPDAP